MEELIKWFVYITINLCNGKIYVGVHRGNPEKFDYIGNGVKCLNDCNKGNEVFKKAVKKYGIANFRRTVIETFPDTDEGKKKAFDLEGQIVTRTFLKSKNVYNTALGGVGSPTQDTKRVYQFALNGNYLRSFISAHDAAISLNVDNVTSALKSIRNNCLGKTNSAFGYYWSYKKEFNYTNNKTRPVAQYTVKGKFLKSYSSITEAEDLLQIINIKQAISKNYLSGGFQWRYYTGDDSDIEPLANVMTKNHVLPIVMFNYSGVRKVYKNIAECVKDNPRLLTSGINRVLKGKCKTHGGWYFQYSSQDEDIV